MGGVPNVPGPSPTLGSLGPSHQWRHKSRASLRGPLCAHGVAGTSQGEVRDKIGSELGVRPDGIIPTIRSLPKAGEMDGLRVRIAGLIRDDDGLQAQVADRNRRLEEAEGCAAAAEARVVAAEEGHIWAEAESTKWHSISRKFFDSLGFAGDVVTKA